MSPEPRRWWASNTTITREGIGIRLNLQTLAATLVVVGILGWALVQFGSSQTGTGPNGSVFVTDVNGAAALAELLERRGHEVVPAVVPLSDLERPGTLMILDPGFRSEFAPDEIATISGWVDSGGRLIVTGRPHPDLVGSVLPDDLRLGFSGTNPADIVTPIRGVDGDVTTDGVYSIETRADMVPLVGDPPVAAVFESGEGVVVYVADGSIFSNPRLVENAPWIVSLIPEGPVVFDEVRHGFLVAPPAESPAGLAGALPDRIRQVVLLLVPVLLLALIVYGRRFGPPEETQRLLAPPRRELMDAVAGLMSRMPDGVAAAEPVKARLRQIVARRAGLPADAEDESLLAAAEEMGIETDALHTSLNASDEDTMLVAQRTLARLSAREDR